MARITQRGHLVARQFVRTSLAVCFSILLIVSTRVDSQSPVNNAPLSAGEVLAVMRAAEGAVMSPNLSVAVVDRAGRILGVVTRGEANRDPDIAVTTARAAAMFSNDQAPLSSRTVRFISGIHFPPGVRNAPPAALYGIENTNRGCQLNAADTAPFERPRSIAGSGLAGPAAACRPSDPSGCAIGESIAVDRTLNPYVGFSTGKTNVNDLGPPLEVPVNPGGFAIYRNGAVVGAVGVTGVVSAVAEFAAFVGAEGTKPTTGLSALPSNPLPSPAAVFIDGLRLPFFGTCNTVECVTAVIKAGAPRGSGGASPASRVVVQPRAGLSVPTGYLIGPTASASPGGLTADDVRRITEQAVARATVTRAQIRLPLTQPTQMIIAVSDEAGGILAAFRMPDATVFSFDVATTKARNAFYFSSREGYEVLRGLVTSNPDQYTWEPEPPAGQGWAITNRALGFGGQPLFPPGIDLKGTSTGPWFELFRWDTLNPCTEGNGASRGQNRRFANQSGIVWFPGSAPLYKGGRLVGGVGVSGDGVEQDDYVTAGAVAGFDAPAALRVDNSVIRTRDGDVRLPYWKFPRNPELR